MLKKIGIGLAAALALFALFVATRPAEFRIERSARIAAPPLAVFALVDDFHAWTRWSPWEKRDPLLEREYTGAGAGEGAVYAWRGNAEIGSGRMTITESLPAERVAIRLEFFEPFEATNQAVFAFREAAGGTEVVWSMEGRNGFAGKLISLFMDMDSMVGKDFEAGLAAMKAAAEADAG